MSKPAWHGWIELASDVNWQDYHGMWAKKGPDGAWYVLVWTNLWDAAGESEDLDQFECQVKRLDLGELPADELKSALRSCGLEQTSEGLMQSYGCDLVDPAWEERAKVEACIGYGHGAPLETFSGGQHPMRIRANARRYAEMCMRDDALVEERLARPVNKIGSTAAEYGRGDIDSALHRGPFDATKTLVRKMYGLES